MPDAVVLGVNGVGYESANDTITDGRDLPWLQDTPEAAVWDLWRIVYRDVVVLDTDGVVVGVVNLTTHDLGDEAAYDALHSLLEP
ncbi:MAG: hypothetical protein AAF602_10765 [Myxococcota bacterium]